MHFISRGRRVDCVIREAKMETRKLTLAIHLLPTPLPYRFLFKRERKYKG
ncbi:hypothetical protein K450DRAFT_297554 [Umbelopsis ramanniana AG]|uniref:Uncharacterized protein n=1 Tax=Umbelopsis ramanniana AG TaxID=1314678 RepID=A0AAD5EFL2_UMBRA|nr:uncharacterized protein K450DRAFT_297554 [Umbelopsis ramanniana AG]KAI8582973.1 hypothetical protein K450DRAFT_297554 [Umbelopsis ramanniana AG]